MSLKDELNQATNKALIAQKQKELMDTVIRNEAEANRLKVARERAQSIIATLSTELFGAANNGKKSYVLTQTDEFGNKPKVVRIDIGGYADLMFNKYTLPIHLNNNVFNNNMQYYFVIEHIVTHLGLDCVLKYEHDGVGESSWHELVINW